MWCPKYRVSGLLVFSIFNFRSRAAVIKLLSAAIILFDYCVWRYLSLSKYTTSIFNIEIFKMCLVEFLIIDSFFISHP